MPTLADLGLEQQVEIFRQFGGPVIDAADIASRPEATLRALCGALDIPFDRAMLAWPAGPRVSDGIWARHWYASVWASTGFEAGRGAAAPAEVVLPPRLENLAARCITFYSELSAAKLMWSS